MLERLQAAWDRLRNHVSPGQATFSNGWLAQYCEDIVTRLRKDIV